MRMLFVLAAVVVLSAHPTWADTDVTVAVDTAWDDMSRSDRSVNALTATPIDPGTFLFVVTHRARQSLTDHAGRDFLGLDAGGLKIGLGLRWGVINGLDAGVFRLNGTAEIFDTVEFDLRSRLLSQEAHGLDVALRPGITWFIQPDQGDASGLFAQLLATRQLGHRATVGAGLLYHQDSSGDRKATMDDDESVALLAHGEFRLTPKLAVAVEAAPNLGGYGENKPSTSIALKVFTYGHTFSLVVSNTQYIGADGIVTGAWREWDEPIIGFTITRDIEP
ncbi:MAG: DUF5777 family beta-barrel protein [Candidatus Eisenbacteria bacterium]|nr:DUF5777 family beta-barrel protein [Candidatus Eisenbacteria bacterium]